MKTFDGITRLELRFTELVGNSASYCYTNDVLLHIGLEQNSEAIAGLSIVKSHRTIKHRSLPQNCHLHKMYTLKGI